MALEVRAYFHNRVKTIMAEYKKRVDDGARRIALRDARRKGRKYDVCCDLLHIALKANSLIHLCSYSTVD